MDPRRKADLKRAYKEAVRRKGVFKIHCAAGGRTWVGRSVTVDTVKNRIWFTLREGNHPNRELQAAWNAAGGEDAFAFEVVEVLPDELAGLALERRLKEREQHWAEELGATRYR